MIVFEIRARDNQIRAFHTRVDGPNGKRLAWRNGDGTPGLGGTPTADLPLYGAHLLGSWPPERAVVVTEGEKAAQALIDLLVPAVGTVTGAATTPSVEVLADLAGRDVVLWPDADEPGHQHMVAIEERLTGVARSIRWAVWADAPAKGDAADYVAAGGDPWDVIDASEPRAAQVPLDSALAGPGWPVPLDPAALIGLAGDFVRIVEPYSEADPAALLFSFLAASGAMIGPLVHALAGDAEHPCRLNLNVVGDTGKGRKGTSIAPVRSLVQLVDPSFVPRITAGLSSGEGLIFHVRDAVEKLEQVGKGADRHAELVVVDEGVTDKRLLVVESEFASVLRVLQRDGNSLSPVMRLAWDHGDLSTLTRNNPLHATGAHISVVGHITKDELRRLLDRTELASGFANRFLFVAARRSKILPEGERVPPELLEPLVGRLQEVLRWSSEPRQLRRDAAATRLWSGIYESLSAGRPGLLGAATNRAEAQALRLSVLYAALDCSPVITTEHVLAGLASWNYAEGSARWIFGDAVGDEVADTILLAVRSNGELTRTEVVDLFSRHVSRAKIERAIVSLVTGGLIVRDRTPTGGRPREVLSAS